jgi:hypothetical protein
MFAAVVFAAVLVVVALLVVKDDPDSGKAVKKGIVKGVPSIVSRGELRDFASRQDGPIYWAGSRTKARLELTQTKSGDVYVRYLTGKAKAGDKNPLYLTVGSYPTAHAYKQLADQKGAKGVLTADAPGGGLAIYRKGQLNVYMAFPGQDVIVEVYAPSAGDALELVTSGDVGVVR